MKIVIDARLYGASKNRGLGRYVEQLVANLERVEGASLAAPVGGQTFAPLQERGFENEYTILLRRDNFDDYQPRNSRFKKVLADYKWYSFAEQILLPLKLWRMDCDLVHFPHFNVPFFCPKKFVVTIHDLTMYKFPDDKATTRNKYLYRIKYWLHKFVVKSAVRRAEAVIVDAEFTKQDVIREFRVDESKVRVVYLGFEMSPEDRGQRTEDRVLEKFGVEGRYLLCVGSAYPHKNLEMLIKAFERVKEEHGDLKLVLVGRKDYFYEKLETRLSTSSSSNENKKLEIRGVIFTGEVSNGELAALYQNALVYVFPSLYEGFGLPGLEAMSYGAPVIAAKASCLPEIYGEAALYFEPENENELAEKIRRVINDEGLRNSLKERGFKQIKKYSWEKCARQTRDTYAHLLEGEGGV